MFGPIEIEPYDGFVLCPCNQTRWVESLTGDSENLLPVTFYLFSRCSGKLFLSQEEIFHLRADSLFAYYLHSFAFGCVACQATHSAVDL